ncbi:MAG TPA: carbonic anhydrase [Anaerolineae bacterium]|nr:carbonic anhydrase [Anaerolineae bacterium]
MLKRYLASSATKRHQFLAANKELIQYQATAGQEPTALLVTCVDSRILPSKLFDSAPGELLTLRNIANTIPPYIHSDIATSSTIEFAVNTLGIPNIIICGHTDCGGIKALDSRDQLNLIKYPSLNRWLDLIAPAKRDIAEKLEGLSDQERHLAIVEQNIRNQIDNLLTYPFIRDKVALGHDHLRLHGLIYDLHIPGFRILDHDTRKFRIFVDNQ